MLNTATFTKELLNKMAGAVVRAAGDTGATLDIVQSAAAKAVAAIESFDASKASFKTWCCTIAANEARNWRKLSAHSGHDSETRTDEDGAAASLTDAMPGEDGRETVERNSLSRALHAAILTLEADEQTFIRAMLDGVGLCDAGAMLGWSKGWASKRHVAIMAKLREEME